MCEFEKTVLLRWQETRGDARRQRMLVFVFKLKGAFTQKSKFSLYLL